MRDEHADTGAKKISYRFDLIFILVFLVFSIGGAFYIYYLEYADGLKNRFGLSILPCFCYTAIGLLVLLFCSIRFLIRVCLPPLALSHILIKIAFGAVPFVIFFGGWKMTIPAAPVFLKGFEKWALKEVDMNAIQQWLATEGQRYKGQYYYSEDFPSEFPACLTKFKPQVILFENSELDGSLYIEFRCGGGIDYWGLRIGPPSMKTPEEGVLKISKSYYEYRRPIAPGVCIFDGG